MLVARVNYRDMAGGEAAGIRGWQAWLADRPQMPYLLPFFAFLIIMAPAGLGSVGGIDFKALWKTYHPEVYAAKSIVAGVMIWYFWPMYTRVRWSKISWGIVLGLVGTVVWIVSEYVCQWTGLAGKPDPATFYNSDRELATQWSRWAYLCVRVAGPSLVVPLMEELFFRDFLMRALIRGARYDDVPVGSFTWFSLLGMSALFGVNHGFDYLIPGFLYGLMMGLLVIRTKSLGACIVAHGVTNWSLYLYVIFTGDWQFM
jgi:CAAX prenyl protease-like protein